MIYSTFKYGHQFPYSVMRSIECLQAILCFFGGIQQKQNMILVHRELTGSYSINFP